MGRGHLGKGRGILFLNVKKIGCIVLGDSGGGEERWQEWACRRGEGRGKWGAGSGKRTVLVFNVDQTPNASSLS